MALSLEQRTAQRQIGGSIRAAGARLARATGLSWRRSANEGEWRMTAQEITDALDILQVRYCVAVEPRKQRGVSRAGYSVRVAWEDLNQLLPWVPALQKLIDAGAAQNPPAPPLAPGTSR